MKLAICDNNANFLQSFRTEIYKINSKISIVCYSSFEKLLNGCRVISFDSVILNTEIEGQSGIDVALEIVKIQPFIEVLFITEKVEKYAQTIFFHSDVFKPFALFIKPINRSFFKHMISLLEQFIFQKKISIIAIKTVDGEILPINAIDIKYIEHNNRKSYIHTIDSTIVCRKSLAYFEEILPASMYFHSSKSIIVNAAEISKIKSGEIILSNGEIIHASRNYKNDFTEKFLKFIENIPNEREFYSLKS